MLSVNNSGKKLLKLEALRGLAALYVVLHHTYPHKHIVGGVNVYNVFRFGQEAVILFFLLSGFVIKYSYSYASDKGFKQYFFKRFLRIYVPLVLVFITSYITLAHQAGELIDPKFPQLLGNLLMLQDWEKVKPFIIVSPYLGNNPLWSLSYEWWFYMLFFPLTVYIKSTDVRNRVVFASCAIAAVIYVFLPIFPVRIAMYFAIWWAGAVLAERYMQSGKLSITSLKLPIMSLLTITILLIIKVIYAKAAGDRILLGMHPLLEARHFVFACVAIIAAVIWQNLGWPLFRQLIMPFALIAPISYTVYIIHLPIMIDGTFFDFIENGILNWLSYFIVMLALAYLIEMVIYPKTRRIVFKHLNSKKPLTTEDKIRTS